MIVNSRARAFVQWPFTWAFGSTPGFWHRHRSSGSWTSWAKMTARAAASGRRAHQRCSVDGCPWRIDFSRADADVDGVERQGDLDQLLGGDHGVGHATSPARLSRSAIE